MSELEQAIPGGFMSIFQFPSTGESGLLVLRDILYAGLRWEDPYLTQSRIGEMLLYDGYDTMFIWKKVYDALVYDQWITQQSEEKQTGQSGQKQDNPITILEMLDNIEVIAYGTMRLTPAELYALTPREFNIMLENFGEVENQRVGLICATILNSQGGKKGGEPFTPDDFFKPKKPKIMSDKEIIDVLSVLVGRKL